MIKIVDVIFTNFLNANDRIYDIMTCEEIIKQYKEKMEQMGVVYGELGHPDNQKKLLKFKHNISTTKISHTIKDLWLESGVLKAEIKILNTHNGKILKKMIDDMVFSSRSAGTIDPVTKKVSVKKFITIDAIDFKDDAFYQRRLREKKLKRILK